MEAPSTQSYVVYSPVSQLVQTVPGANQTHESSWHLPSPSATSAHPSPMFSVGSRPDLDYPSPAPSSASPPYSHPHTQTEPYSVHHSLPTLHGSVSNEAMQFNQIEASIGPSRVLRSRRRVALENSGQGRRASMPSSFQRPGQHSTNSPRHSSAMYLTPPTGTSRPQTPRNEQSGEFQSQRDRVSVNIANTAPLQVQSPSYQPMTPASLLSPFSPYIMYNHPRSASDLQNHQPASPALSNVSALTSVSSASGPGTQTFAPYPLSSSHGKIIPRKNKQRKQRLTNVDRKAICTHHLAFPNARQEDIASKFGVERSTISKILKQKQKWLNMPEQENSRVAKHRPSKFPEVEEELVIWLEEMSRTNKTITDNSIREKAKETARMLNITDEKFKASSGWIENFKSRHGIRSGVWSGNGPRSHAAVPADRAAEFVLSPLNPSFIGRSQDSGMNIDPPHDDVDLESEGSPEPEEEEEHPADDHHMAEPTVRLPATWPEHASSSSSSSHVVDQSSPASQHSSSQSQQHQAPAPPHISPVLAHQHVPEVPQAHVQYVGQPPVYYQPTPAIPEPRVPNIQDAEDAINTLITFIDSEGRGILEDDERQILTTIKCALFQAASGIPFNRNR